MAGQSDQLDISLLESYKRRRIAIANMPEIPPSPPPPHFDHLTPSEFDDARTHRIGHLRGRVAKAFTAAKGNPADGRWGALSDLLSLSCTAGREGRWIGLRLDPAPGGGEEEDDDEVLDQLGVVLARTEEEWFAWEARYEKRMNVRRRVGAWSRGVELPAAAESPPVPSRSRPRRKSPLHVVVSADEPEEEEEEEVVEIVPPVAAKAKTRVARMSTGGKSPRRPKAQEEQQVASTSGTSKLVNIVSATTVPDALKNSAPFGFGVVKRPTAKGKEKAKATDAPPKKKAEELKKKKQQERVEWEKGRERKLREAREREAEKARQDKEKEEAERRRRQEEEEAEKRRREDEAEEAVVLSDKGQGRRMQIQDVSEMSFIPPSFPSSAVMHSTPKPLVVRLTKPFGRRNTSPLIPRLDETRRNDKVVEVPPPLPQAEESSYSLGVSMVTSAELPSQILIPPPTTTKKRTRPVSPTPSPVIRGERPEKKARNDEGLPAREPLQEPNGDVSEISFLPPSFPPGGIVTSTPKPPSKSTSLEKAKATGSPKQRETTPTPSSTRPFLLPPTPRTKALEASASLPAIPPQQPSPVLPSSPSSPSNHRQPNKRPASPSPPPARGAHALLKKAKTMPAAALVSPPSSPTRRLSSPAKAPDSWLRSPGARRVRNVPSAEDAIVARTTLLNVRHVLADQRAAAPVLPLVPAALLPVTPQKRRHALPTLTDLLASSTRARKGKGGGSASAKKLRKTLIVRTPSGERVDLMAVGALKLDGTTKGQGKADGSQQNGPGNVGGEQQEENEREESVRDNAEPSTMGTGLENYQQLKAAANASTDIFLVDSSPPPPYFGSNADNNALALPESQPAMDSPPPPQSAEPPTDPYSDAYHFTEDIVVPTGSKLRTFPGAGGSYPFASGGVDPYADNPYDDPYASAGEHVGISPTKSLSSLAGSDSDSSGDDAADGSESDDSPLRRRTGGGGFGFGAGVLSPGFVFDPRAASTQVPPGLNFGVGTGGGGSSSLFSAATSGARSVPPAVEAAKQPAASQESKDSWASMYVSSAPAERASSGNSAKDPSPQYALPEALQPAPSSSSPMHAERNSSTPVHAPPPPSSSNPRFSFSSQAFGGNLAKHVDMVSRLLDKDVDFGGWLKDPEEIDEPQRGVEESP